MKHKISDKPILTNDETEKIYKESVMMNKPTKQNLEVEEMKSNEKTNAITKQNT